MNRGRFIGLASLPVLFLGAPSYANEVNATTPVQPPPVAGDAQWADRWKAAAAERAARQVRANAAAAKVTPSPKAGIAKRSESAPPGDDWAARWKAASEALEAKKAANREARRSRPPAPVRPSTPAPAPANPASATKL